MSDATTNRTGTAAGGSVIRDRALTIVAAVVVALVVWGIGRLLVGDDVAVTMSGADEQTSVGPVAVIATTIIAGLVAWGVLALLERFTASAARIFLILGVVVLLLSLSGPLAQGEGTGPTITLLALHVAVGAVLIAGLLRTVRPRA